MCFVSRRCWVYKFIYSSNRYTCDLNSWIKKIWLKLDNRKRLFGTVIHRTGGVGACTGKYSVLQGVTGAYSGRQGMCTVDNRVYMRWQGWQGMTGKTQLVTAPYRGWQGLTVADRGTHGVQGLCTEADRSSAGKTQWVTVKNTGFSYGQGFWASREKSISVQIKICSFLNKTH